eukprot:gene54546-74723_t
MVGAGGLAPFLVKAHRSVRPLTDIAIWARRPEAAEAVAAQLVAEGIEARAVTDLEGEARTADIISCATNATQPLIHGRWRGGAGLYLRNRPGGADTGPSGAVPTIKASKRPTAGQLWAALTCTGSTSKPPKPPSARPGRSSCTGRAYSLDELIDPTDTQQRAFYEKAMLPQGLTNMQSIRVTEPGGIDLWLGCSGGRQIGSATGALLTALAPHLRIALRSFAALERERFRSSVTGQVFDRLKMGWLSLDAGCRIID